MAIGETILGAVLQVVIDKLASKEVMNFFGSSKFDESLVRRLESLMRATGKLHLDAEEKQMTDLDVKRWLDELKHWFYRAEEVVNKIATETLRLSLEKESPPQPQPLWSQVTNFIHAFSNSSSFQKDITLEIGEVVEMLETMLGQKDVLGLKEVCVGRALEAQRVPSTHLLEDSKVYGRDKVKSKILELLVSEEAKRNRISVVAIVGMGGIGKTTLAKHVFNDEGVKGTFDTKVWVCVSDPFDISQVTRSILESVTNRSDRTSQDLNILQTELSAKLREKRFLLVLDDVWNEKYEDWERLRAPFSVAAYGSKIIVTTRNEEVASIMITAPVFRLKPLEKADAWSLFSRHAFELGNSISNPCLEDVGKKIVQKCQGLPLAIKTLGGLLRNTCEISEWEMILESRLWDLPCNKSNVVPALWLSYCHLPSHLKRCFSYCAIFPKDYEIERKQLVLLWMAENLLLPTHSERRIEDLGEDYLRQLLSRSFLEPRGKSYVAMHDLMHDLAQDLSGDFLSRNELQTPPKFPERARHFSYVSDLWDGITKFQAIRESKHLRTFLQLKRGSFRHLTKVVSTEIVPQLHCLRVLSLSGYENLQLPDSIERLKQLCYLDVSWTKISQLPESVSTLYNLQTLLLKNCRCIERLPEGLASLASLRHLDITETTSLLQMPKHMSKLKSLQTLTGFVVGKKGGSSIQELQELKQIRGIFALRRLQNVAAPKYGFYADLSNRELIDELALEFDSEDNDDSERARLLLGDLKPHRNLKRLTITKYAGTKFPCWLDPPECAVYTNLTYVRLSDCQYCFSLPPLGQLPSLKELKIVRMEYIAKVGPEFYGHDNSGSRGPFAALEKISFWVMKGWEVWSNVDVNGNAVCFPRLRMLTLFHCPKLKGSLPGHAPSLQTITIDGCGQLNQPLPSVPFVHEMEITPCPNGELVNAFNVTSITGLRLDRLVQLVNLPPQVDMFSRLSCLEIWQCDNLKSLADVRLPRKLKSLTIRFCKVLESLPGGMKFLTHLQEIELDKCCCLRWVPGDSLPTSLSSLRVSCCEMLEFPIPKKRMKNYTSLERIEFRDASSYFVSFPVGILPNLRSLWFSGCKGLEKVYIPEGIGEDSLMPLSRVTIGRCPQLKMIGKVTERGESTVLPAPNLICLRIEDCEKVKPVMIEREGEILLPKLTDLRIGKSSKMTSSEPLGLRRSLVRFSCLERLNIEDKEGEWFPDPDEGSWGSLPTSLRDLSISNCGKLRRVDGKALLKLTSLQKLSISKCPKLERLPEEGLPPSLGCLSISRCPKVEERCEAEKGLDWSIIKHIPDVWIGGRCVTGP